ncbi:uncharacterized protein LOC135171107 [Diachasmimorpha longicaudata]|uniref:uncharacterized protein LOC135171107 n=1 Tax=Diachasmimorpha longicaudata TaxID=58733 RepID=UPI0030B868ED
MKKKKKKKKPLEDGICGVQLRPWPYDIVTLTRVNASRGPSRWDQTLETARVKRSALGPLDDRDLARLNRLCSNLRYHCHFVLHSRHFALSGAPDAKDFPRWKIERPLGYRIPSNTSLSLSRHDDVMGQGRTPFE